MKSFKALLFCIMALSLTVTSCKTKGPSYEKVQEMTFEEVKAHFETSNEYYKNELISYEITYKDYENSSFPSYVGTCVVKTESLSGDHRIREHKRGVKVRFKDKGCKTYALFYYND